MTAQDVSSLADVSMASRTRAAHRIRVLEICHNIRLMTVAPAVAARALEERKYWFLVEDTRLRERIERRQIVSVLVHC